MSALFDAKTLKALQALMQARPYVRQALILAGAAGLCAGILLMYVYYRVAYIGTPLRGLRVGLENWGQPAEVWNTRLDAKYTVGQILLSYRVSELHKLSREVSWALYITDDGRILASEQYDQFGTQTEVYLPAPQLIVQRCRELNAHKVILIHNHPDQPGMLYAPGSALPSRIDIDSERSVGLTLAQEGIVLLDFMILSSTGYFSLRAARLKGML